MEGVFMVKLDLDERYKHLIKSVIKAATIFMVVIFLREEKTTPGEYLLYGIVGELFYTMIVEYILVIS